MARGVESASMGDAARRAYLRRTTPAQRFDDGLRLAEAAMRAALREEGFPDEPRTEEQTRAAFRALLRRSRG
jgi:hypothetical protein